MNQTQIGELLINLKIKTEAIEKGVETAKKKLEELEKQNGQVQSSNNQLDASFIAMSASIVASLVKITSAVQDGVNKYNSYVNSMNALQKTAIATNNSMSDIENTIEDVNNLKLMDESDLNASIKNLLLYGYTAEQAADILKVLQDAAVGNRQASYSLSEAVRVTTEGIRMENSVLTDAAGVQKNISKMYEEYAASIGKSTDELTQAEKAQAVYNGIMAEASMFTGAAAEMASGYQGQQAQLNATSLELSRTIGDSMIPVLTQYSTIQLAITKGLSEFIGNHKTATSGVISFTITLLAMIVGLTAAKKAYTAYTTAAAAANMTTKAFTASLLSNPITLIAVGVAAAISGLSMLCTAINENEEATARLEETTKRYNDIKNGTYSYTDENVAVLEQDKANIEEQISLLEKQIELEQKIKEIENQSATGSQQTMNNMNLSTYKRQLKETTKALEEAREENGSYGNSLDELNDKLKTNADGMEKANAIKNISKAFDVDTIKNQQKEAAQLKVNADQLQDYLDIIKTANKTSTEYQNAVEAVAKAYPEASSAGGILVDVLQGIVDAQQLQADEAWSASQQTIQGHIANIQAALDDESVQRQVAENLGIAYDQSFRPKLEAILQLLQLIAGYTPSEVPNITPTTVTTPKRTSSSSSYQNKALDNYKKQIEHKKALDQLSIQQEIEMYEYALRRYAKTADEKNEIREKIYDLNKELAQREKELLDQQTEDYENYIQDQINNRGAEYDVQDRTRDYDQIIQMHRNYLNQIMQDERLSLEERKELYREELQTIRDYEQQKRDLRVEAIDNTVSQLTDAITKQLEEMQEKDKEMIDKNLEEVENWKNARIDAINEEYDARIEAIDKELEALNKAEEQKSRDEEDAEYEQKRKRLEELIAFEHDATNKANYQKQLDELIAEYQKTLDERALQDKKDALNEQKELLQQEQDDKVQAIEDEAEKQKEAYENQLEELEKYYDEQIDIAQKTAEQMLLNVNQNQDKILELLKKYGDAYEITGQSLGEKLAQGINNGVANNIQNVIQRIQDIIDTGIENKINEWTSSGYMYNAAANKPQVASKTINVYQTNNIEQNPELPSETYRKLKNIDEQLAAQLAGI